ncbi:pilus assembly protein TadG-related protein [Frankia sp. Mgl5]|uniref:pilus assembly protein TadG-related protein n=1 Tax=Frankia sp. Mgl5 TaxID=2933793 RepID=UPI00201002D2|nr:pilus assembly protein TadG-related protein [Frankia sp. Mgl5]MCK9932022.1 pilus assembly protein TadG-related protein [Frankia sp. Mgl5]
MADAREPVDRDGGTILILTLGYLMLAAMLAVVVTDVSALYLARRSVASAADGAALAAVQRIDENAIYTATEDFEALPLSDIVDAVDEYEAQADPSGRTALDASLVDATTVRVEGSRTVELPVVGFLGVGPVTVRAGAQARSLVRPLAGP